MLDIIKIPITQLIDNGSDSSKKSLGGGTILDLGVYAIQFAQFVFRSEPTSITAKGKLNDEGVDVETEVEMKYANGGVARFKTSGLRELENKANVRGSKGFMTVRLQILTSALGWLDGDCVSRSAWD